MNPHFDQAHHDACFAQQVLLRGDVFTIIHECSDKVTEEVDWVRTARYHRDWLPSVKAEARLLPALAAAVELGLATMRLTPLAGDSAAYSVRWHVA